MLEGAGDLRGKRVVVSACLLGRECRYDGRHKRAAGLAEELAAAGAEVVAVCPETDAGLGVPRPPMDLHETAEGVRALRADGTDCTGALERWIGGAVSRLKAEGGVAAFVLKSKSPSCDVGGAGRAEGLFARAAREEFPEAARIEVSGGDWRGEG